jgi:hypothetical protein
MLTVKNTLRGTTIQVNESWWNAIQKQMARDKSKANRRIYHADGSPVFVLEGSQVGQVQPQPQKKSQDVKNVDAKFTKTVELPDETIEKFIPLCKDEAAIERIKSKLTPAQLDKFAGALLKQAESFKVAMEKATPKETAKPQPAKAETKRATKSTKK